MKIIITILLTMLILGTASNANAQDDNPAIACRAAADLFEEGSLTEALEEANWCVESLQQLKQDATASVFPDEINGFIGSEVKSQNTFGLHFIERFYSSATERIEVKFTAGGAGGGLAALANLGLTMGGAGKKMRINRYKVLDVSTPQNVQFVVTMKSGGSLNVSSMTASYETVLAFLKKLPFKKIDEATGS